MAGGLYGPLRASHAIKGNIMKNMLTGIFAILLIIQPYFVMRYIGGWSSYPRDIGPLWFCGALLEGVVIAIPMGLWVLGTYINEIKQ